MHTKSSASGRHTETIDVSWLLWQQAGDNSYLKVIIVLPSLFHSFLFPFIALLSTLISFPFSLFFYHLISCTGHNLFSSFFTPHLPHLFFILAIPLSSSSPPLFSIHWSPLCLFTFLFYLFSCTFCSPPPFMSSSLPASSFFSHLLLFLLFTISHPLIPIIKVSPPIYIFFPSLLSSSLLYFSSCFSNYFKFSSPSVFCPPSSLNDHNFPLPTPYSIISPLCSFSLNPV